MQEMPKNLKGFCNEEDRPEQDQAIRIWRKIKDNFTTTGDIWIFKSCYYPENQHAVGSITVANSEFPDIKHSIDDHGQLFWQPARIPKKNERGGNNGSKN